MLAELIAELKAELAKAELFISHLVRHNVAIAQEHVDQVHATVDALKAKAQAVSDHVAQAAAQVKADVTGVKNG